MKLTTHMTDEQILFELGARLSRLRLELNLTQKFVAKQAGVGLRTLQRLETGAVASQLSVFLRVCRVLGVLERLDALLPRAVAGPLEKLYRRGKPRLRASGKRKPAVVAEPWSWGDNA